MQLTTVYIDSNLGALYQTQGDLDKAEDMFNKSKELFENINSPQVEIVQKNLEGVRKEKLARNL